MAACIVSFVDLDGIRHSVEVEAEGLYEASVLGICAFRKHELEPAGLTELDVEVRSSVTHTLPVRKVSRVVTARCQNAERGRLERAPASHVSVIASALSSIFQNRMRALRARLLSGSYPHAILETKDA